MKKLIAILMTCSLALAASVQAQQDDEQKAAKKKHRQEARAERQAGPAQGNAPAGKPAAGGRRMKERAAAPENAAAPAARENANRAGNKAEMRAQKRADRQGAKADVKTEKPAAETNVQASDSTAPNAQKANRRNQKVNAQATTDTSAAADKKGRAAKVNAQPTTQAAAATAPAGNKPRGKKMTAEAKKAVVQKVKAKNANFKAQARPQQVPAVTFSSSRTISGSQNWQGENYSVFRSYRPERHDRNYYHSHFNRIELIAGGYYYFNNGYWYPAWGYQPSAQYYVYDGPIYAGHRAEPPDRVIADVQASLQEMGYYRGEVDGLLGPLTREALTGYQSDYGLYTTAAIDEPTLQSLGI